MFPPLLTPSEAEVWLALSKVCVTHLCMCLHLYRLSGVQAGIIVRSLHHEVCVVLNLLEPLIDTVQS